MESPWRANVTGSKNAGKANPKAVTLKSEDLPFSVDKAASDGRIRF